MGQTQSIPNNIPEIIQQGDIGATLASRRKIVDALNTFASKENAPSLFRIGASTSPFIPIASYACTAGESFLGMALGQVHERLLLDFFFLNLGLKPLADEAAYTRLTSLFETYAQRDFIQDFLPQLEHAYYYFVDRLFLVCRSH